MSFDDPTSDIVEQARAAAARGESLLAESLCLSQLALHPANVSAPVLLADLASARGQSRLAASWLARAHATAPTNLAIALRLVMLHWEIEDWHESQAVLERSLKDHDRSDPDTPFGWLLLGELRLLQGAAVGAARAWHQALTLAAHHKQWLPGQQLSPAVRALVDRARAAARAARLEHLQASYVQISAKFGASAIRRIDEAVHNLTSESPVGPADTRQRPRFLYVPGVPSEPYLDPYLVAWAPRLRDAFLSIQQEALEIFESGEQLPRFLDLSPQARMGQYLGGSASKPAWDAFFFFRRGKRYDENHLRCPKTSALLESLDLFRMTSQAPEICYSFLAPRTEILPHYGVSNIRSVMHLPLKVPSNCALNLIGVGERHWKNGELILFDDTYLHEAWNRSDEMRIVLLIDCWNPNLTMVERSALTALVEAIGEFDQAL